MKKEFFKEIEIEGFKLLVSNTGRVFKNDKELNKVLNHDGYYQVNIGKNKTRGVHRLVAFAFIENDDPENKKEVNHKDFNRINNIPENLEWLSHADNVRYSYVNGRYPDISGEKNPNYGNRKLSKFYKENPEIALEKQSRKGTQNGMSKKVKLFKDSILIKEFDIIKDCCEYLHKNFGFSSNPEVIRIGIRKSIKNNKPYKGFTFEK